ncbi:MAG: HAD hydrolase-like protein [Bacteroidaceae bacterium]|nr:HAD hydrolase-like protein [Bacteroidaceae bacterium]
MDYIKAIENYTQLHNHDVMQLRAVLFDMDGVLFDSMPYHAEAWSQVMTEAGYNFSKEDVYMNEGRTGADTINTASLAQFGRLATQEHIDALCKAKCEVFDTYPPTPRMQGALELVQKVKDCGLTPMIVTGSGTPTLLDRIQSNFPGLFDANHIVSSFNVKRGKPYPDPYLLALEKGGFKANEAIVVENAPLGVTAGVAADLFTIAANTGPLKDNVLSDAGASLVFPSMQALCDEWEKLYNCIKLKI